jgi:hypothetical protein
MNPLVIFDACPQSSSSTFCVFAPCSAVVSMLLTAVSLEHCMIESMNPPRSRERALRGHRGLQPRVLRESASGMLLPLRGLPRPRLKWGQPALGSCWVPPLDVRHRALLVEMQGSRKFASCSRATSRYGQGSVNSRGALFRSAHPRQARRHDLFSVRQIRD